MIKIILLLIIIVAFIGINIYYQNKLETLKHQLRVMNIKNSTKSETKNIYPSKIQVNFSTPESIMGIINENVALLIAPLKATTILKTTNVKMEVKILDKVSINNQVWYYVSLPINENINCRGWVNKKDFTIMYSQSTDLST